MTKNKHFRSVFAALLCAVLCMTAFATVAYADGGDYYDDELPPETWQEEPQPEDTTIVPGTPFTEDGIAATRDLLYDKHTNIIQKIYRTGSSGHPRGNGRNNPTCGNRLY